MPARSHSPSPEPVRLVDDTDSAADLLGVSPRTFAELRKRSGFPKPVALLGPLRPRWRRADLVAYVEGLPTLDEPAAEPAPLRSARRAKVAQVKGAP
jgi:hypothetical protein